MELKTNTNNNSQGDPAIVEVSDAKQAEKIDVHRHSCHSSCGCSDVEPQKSFNIKPIVAVDGLTD